MYFFLIVYRILTTKALKIYYTIKLNIIYILIIEFMYDTISTEAKQLQIFGLQRTEVDNP